MRGLRSCNSPTVWRPEPRGRSELLRRPALIRRGRRKARERQSQCPSGDGLAAFGMLCPLASRLAPFVGRLVHEGGCALRPKPARLAPRAAAAGRQCGRCAMPTATEILREHGSPMVGHHADDMPAAQPTPAQQDRSMPQRDVQA